MEQQQPIKRESRQYEHWGYKADFGRASHMIKCPFCGSEVRAFVWSLAGGGKKCPGCGAMHTGMGLTLAPLPKKQRPGRKMTAFELCGLQGSITFTVGRSKIEWESAVYILSDKVRISRVVEATEGGSEFIMGLNYKARIISPEQEVYLLNNNDNGRATDQKES